MAQAGAEFPSRRALIALCFSHSCPLSCTWTVRSTSPRPPCPLQAAVGESASPDGVLLRDADLGPNAPCVCGVVITYIVSELASIIARKFIRLGNIDPYQFLFVCSLNYFLLLSCAQSVKFAFALRSEERRVG